MALDTVNKRRAVLGLFSPTCRPLPIPDGGLEVGDRYHFALMNNTEEGGEVPGAVNSLIFLAGMRSRLDFDAGMRSRLDFLGGLR